MTLASLLTFVLIAPPIQPNPKPTEIAIIVGPDSHAPDTHEAASGGRLLKHLLESSKSGPKIKAIVYEEWPKSDAELNKASTLVFLGDLFPPSQFAEKDKVMESLGRLMDKGVGIVCLHYATGIHPNDLPKEGEHPLLKWMGGYFANPGTPGHSSISRIYQEAKITPKNTTHPINRGWKEFVIHDEPYTNNYFGKDGPGKGVTLLATSMLPPDSPKEETVAWSIQRPDKGRGFGVVMPHFYKNWLNQDLRKLILNGIVWTARQEVPKNGFESEAPNLEQFKKP
jgi:type 1 glutamine amidotransferase